MKALIEKTKKREIDCILVKDFSRFGRDYLRVSDYIEQIFPSMGIRFISVNDGYDSAGVKSPAEGLEMSFRHLVNAWYSQDISEKEKSSKQAKARRGDFLSPYAPIGYQKDKSNRNHLVIEEKGAGIVRYIYRLAGMGFRVKSIARLLNGEGIPTPSALKREQGYSHPWWEGIQGESLWDISSVTRILRDERYLGKNIYGKRSRLTVGNYQGKQKGKEKWIIVSGCHEPIVTEKEFQAAQKMLCQYREIRERGKGEGAFSGKIRCGVCGYALSREKGKHFRYCCRTRERTGRFACMKGKIDENELAEVIEYMNYLYGRVFADDGEAEGKRAEGSGKEGEKRKWRGRQGSRITGEAEREQEKRREKQQIYCRAENSLEEQKAVLYERLLEGKIDREQYKKRHCRLSERQDELRREREALEEVSAGGLLPEARAEDGEEIRRIADNHLVSICVYQETAIHICWKAYASLPQAIVNGHVTFT